MVLAEETELIIASHEGFNFTVKEVHLVLRHHDLRVVVGCHQFVEGLPEFYVGFAKQSIG